MIVQYNTLRNQLTGDYQAFCYEMTIVKWK